LAGIGHHAPVKREVEDPSTVAFNTQLGLWLFLIYASCYAAFVLINTFRPQLMQHLIAGVNLAVWSGFGLIGLAWVMAIIYMRACRGSHRKGHVNAAASKEPS
jgi:uncharacterized membrane protein (DUF485 family)